MSIETSIEVSRNTKSVPDDKFDRHMKRARVNDIESRRKTFVRQTEVSVEREEKRRDLTPSVY